MISRSPTNSNQNRVEFRHILAVLRSLQSSFRCVERSFREIDVILIYIILTFLPPTKRQQFVCDQEVPTRAAFVFGGEQSVPAASTLIGSIS